MSDFESKGQRFVALCMLGCCCSTIRCSRCSTCGHAVRRAGALRLHLRRLGGADRADGVVAESGQLAPSHARRRMLHGTDHHPHLVRLSRAAVRDRLLRRPARRRRPLGHRQPVHLQPVARGLRDRLDVLRQRRARGERRRRLPADLHRADADDRAVVGRDAQDPAHHQAEPHHLARRLHRLALRQERAARRPGHRDRGDRHPALHLAAAEGGLHQLRDPGAVPRDHHAGARSAPRRSARTPRSGWR